MYFLPKMERITMSLYSLEMIMAIGYRVHSIRCVHLRQRATRHISEFLVKGVTMYDESLKHPNGRADYFDELLIRMRDILTSEKHFCQKLRELFALISDCESKRKVTKCSALRLKIN